MTISITLSPETLSLLEAEAQASGQDVETCVRESVEAKLARSKRSLSEALEPLQDAVAAGGMTPHEAEALFEQELATVRAERRVSQAKR